MKNTTKTESTFAGNGQQVSYNAICKAASLAVAAYNKRKLCTIPEYDIPDIVNETVTKALEAIDSYDSSKSGIETWTSTIAHNCICDYWEGRAKREGWGYDKISSYSDNESGDIEDEYCTYRRSTKGAPLLDNLYSDSDPAEEVSREELKGWLYSHIDRLPDKSKSIIELHLAGIKPAQIAAQLGCTSNAVSVNLHRAIEALKKMAEDEYFLVA